MLIVKPAPKLSVDAKRALFNKNQAIDTNGWIYQVSMINLPRQKRSILFAVDAKPKNRKAAIDIGSAMIKPENILFQRLQNRAANYKSGNIS